jgi:hypothetical protein
MFRGVVVGLVIGLAGGLAIGWVYFSGDTARSERVERREDPVATASTAPGDSTPDEGDSAPSVSAARKPLDPHGRAYVYPQVVDGKRNYTIDGEPVAARPIEQIDAAMARARAEKNWPEYLRGILELILLDTPDAHARLVAILRDESLSLRGPWIGQRFYEGLKASQVEGIAEAARARARIEMEQKKDNQRAGLGFLALVALHGGDSDHAWIESLTGTNAGIAKADRAFAEGARNPAAAERMRRRYMDKGVLHSGEWIMFARENPAVAFDTARDLVRRDPTLIENYRLLGYSTTAETLEQARTLLNHLPNDDARMLAIRAVQQMSLRKLDTSGFDDIIATPRVVIEEILSERRTPVQAAVAIDAIKYCTVAQTEENLAALRALAEKGKPTSASHAKSALKTIAFYKNQTGGWEPDR